MGKPILIEVFDDKPVTKTGTNDKGEWTMTFIKAARVKMRGKREVSKEFDLVLGKNDRVPAAGLYELDTDRVDVVVASNRARMGVEPIGVDDLIPYKPQTVQAAA